MTQPNQPTPSESYLVSMLHAIVGELARAVAYLREELTNRGTTIPALDHLGATLQQSSDQLDQFGPAPTAATGTTAAPGSTTGATGTAGDPSQAAPGGGGGAADPGQDAPAGTDVYGQPYPAGPTVSTGMASEAVAARAQVEAEVEARAAQVEAEAQGRTYPAGPNPATEPYYP